MKALGLVVSDKKTFENCILKTYFLTSWPTNTTTWDGLNNFDRGPPRDHSCEVWSKSVSEEMLFKEIVDERTLYDGQWTITKSHIEHFVLRWAKKWVKVTNYLMSVRSKEWCLKMPGLYRDTIIIGDKFCSMLKELEHRKLGWKVLVLKYDLDKSLSKEMWC